jgi:hypothetical protein
MRTGLSRASILIHGSLYYANHFSALMDSIKADHGYNLDSKSVRNLLQTMSEFSEEQRRDFLQFITGSPKLPIGGKSSFLYLIHILSLTLSRLQEPHSHVHRRLQAQRTTIHLGRLSPIRHDLRQLPQDARLQHRRHFTPEADRRHARGPGRFPSFLSVLSGSAFIPCNTYHETGTAEGTDGYALQV